MADIIDDANEAAEIFRRAALSQRKHAHGPEYTGECHNCGRPTPAPKRWCDAHCRDDYEARAHAGLL